MLSRLKAAFDRHPLRFQMLSTGLLMASGDVISQSLFERGRGQKYNPYRTLRFFGLGCFYVGPAVRTWYHILEHIKFGGPKVVPLIRVGFDQLVFSPVFLSSFLVILRLFEHDTLSDAVTKMRNDILPIYATNLKVWPAVQIANFYLVPLEFRVVVVQIVGLFWNTYIAWATHRHKVATIDSTQN